MVLRWLEAALDDLRAIKAYIAEENPDAARRVIASIRSETGIIPRSKPTLPKRILMPRGGLLPAYAARPAF